MLLAGLAQRGLASATAALAAFPVTTPTLEIATRLGVTAVNLGKLLREETAGEGLQRLAARLLVGELTQYLGDEGWPPDNSKQSVMRVIRARLGVLDILGDDMKHQINGVFDRLWALSPTHAWRPTTIDDPNIVRAFEQW